MIEKSGVVVVDGREYILKETTNAYCRLEQLTGMRIGALLAAAADGSLAAARALTWANLQ